MEQEQIFSSSVYDQIPPLSANHQWIVAQNLDAKHEMEVQIFYSVHDPLRHYRCRIPELLGKHVRGCFYGWVILSDHPHNVMWSFWNPVTSKVINFPRLIFKHDDDDDIEYCSLTSPPDVTGEDEDDFLNSLTCCNGKVYASTISADDVVEVTILVKDTGVAINLVSLVMSPDLSLNCHTRRSYLVGTCKDLFCIYIDFHEFTKTISDVYLFKLDMNSKPWEELEDLKDATIILEIDGYLCPEFHSLAIGSKLGGYIHILGEIGGIIYSYHVKDKTISLLFVPCLAGTSHVSTWAMLGCKRLLEGDHKQEEDKKDKIVVSKVKSHEVEFISTTYESHLLNLPFDILEIIIESCVGVEYMNFHASCKLCYLAAPTIQWSNQTASKRLQLQYGWQLMRKIDGALFFFNPFTSDTRKLPRAPYLESFDFSAPPTSPDCIIVGFTSDYEWHVHIRFVGRESSWRKFVLTIGNDDPYLYRFLAFYGGDVYALRNGKGVDVFKELGIRDHSWEWKGVLDEAPISSCTSKA
ncbi:hypothetical protein Tco_1352732 [Tanacetum coccineum]